MTKLAQVNSKFRWDEDCEKSFCHLKEQLVTALILSLPEPGKHFAVYSDASQLGLGMCAHAGQKSYCLCIPTVEAT